MSVSADYYGLQPRQVKPFCPEALSCILLLIQQYSYSDVDLIADVYVYKQHFFFFTTLLIYCSYGTF